MKIYDYLYKVRNKKNFSNSEEFILFKNYKHILEEEPYFYSYSESNNLFDIIKASIIIKGIMNKNTMDRIIDEELLNTNFNTVEEIDENIKERILDLPYLRVEGQKIYIPFFNRSTNLVYSEEFNKTLKEPYINLKKKYSPFIVDPFETYKLALFNSLFTKFIKVYEDNTAVAYYHYDLKTIFVVNREGYLDNFICIFDKHLKNPSNERIINRVKDSMEKYFDNNLVSFIYSLYENKLISYFVFRRLCKWKNI